MNSASVFRPTSASDFAELAPFLTRALSIGTGARGFSEEDLHWKYCVSRPEWEGSRSYVLVGRHGIEAHCGLVPVCQRSPAGQIRSAHFIDWAADSEALGAGVRVLRKVRGLVHVLLAVGGTQATRTIMPVIGFGRANDAVLMARPIRPLRQALTHQKRDWKRPIRLVRNSVWARIPPIRAPIDWSVEQVDTTQVPANLWVASDMAPVSRERMAGAYAYYATCPFVRFRLFLMRHRHNPLGCILLGSSGGQARIADIWATDRSPETLIASYRLALVAALQDTSVAEVVACVSTVTRYRAAMASGFREYRREPIMVLPADGLSLQDVDYQPLDDDTAFLGASETPEYIT
jgi:hypothetical protein